ncbi:hypothetical protein CEXT_330181 [Caerostris extrusa]|uniref:Uncharacterized protein n=1 Tax=Caerostris extrusa TaxID=172846 RepID=A0AAV4SJH7_CAEEX|nr:hypothetical protein CEXT_330181 [Caerostris extrusa]
MKRTDGAFEWLARVKCSSAPHLLFVPPPISCYFYFIFFFSFRSHTRVLWPSFTLFFAVKVPVTACDGACRYFHGGFVLALKSGSEKVRMNSWWFFRERNGIECD